MADLDLRIGTIVGNLVRQGVPGSWDGARQDRTTTRGTGEEKKTGTGLRARFQEQVTQPNHRRKKKKKNQHTPARHCCLHASRPMLGWGQRQVAAAVSDSFTPPSAHPPHVVASSPPPHGISPPPLASAVLVPPPPSSSSMFLHPDPVPSRPLSLHQLVAQHPRERLYTHPVEWTARHLELLRCEFAEFIPPPPTQHAHRNSTPLKRRRAKAAKSWAEGRGVSRSFAVRNLLSTSNDGELDVFSSVAPAVPPFTRDSSSMLTPRRKGSYFHYHKRRTARTQCYTFAFPAADAPTLPIAAWTEPSLNNMLRRDAVGSSRQGRRRNSPVRRMAEVKYRALIPPDGWKDPYILVLLIAVAQWQRFVLVSQGLWDRPLFQVCKMESSLWPRQRFPGSS